ncbi:MAG: hypothetical protein IM584_00250 [Chitinophagaceae bacterium]|nr:hypothetical protein [Chitinophagaceae bacterium]MEA3426523.1 hypothetical protein [Bacteroidota bacterium]MCA6452914.1 hypothetical protein [Chitinophagaceae bacterium]MCA6454540.1 hypothetical protein [Chitinophagaceae bacterium]MCA6458532.1 hypothetical protein [Chitinophagaceae bacterium]
MGNLAYQELLLLFVSLFCMLIPVLMVIWMYRIARRSHSNQQRIAQLETQLQVLEAKISR